MIFLRKVIWLLLALLLWIWALPYVVADTPTETLKPLTQKEVIDTMIKNNKKCMDKIKGKVVTEAFFRLHPECHIKTNI